MTDPPDKLGPLTGSTPDRGGNAPAGTPPGTDPPSAPPERKFEIEWFEEDSEPEKGRLFASPQPEPPPQPFEIIREPHPARRGPLPGSPPRSPATGPAPAPGPVPAPAAPPPTAPPRPPLWKRLIWGSMPILLLLGGYASVVLTQADIGHAWDEAYYYEPSMQAADWLIGVLRGRHPFDRQSIDESWSLRSEHPSVQKLISGLSIRMFPNPKDHLYAMRLPMAVLFGLSLTLIYLLGRRAWGIWPGLASALIFATMPRIYGHAHIASMEMPLLFFSLLVVYCYLRGLDSAFWSVTTGIAFGLLLATKINAFFLPIPLLLWSQLYARRQAANNVFSMLTLGPLTMLAVWPWLWPDPVGRLLAYLSFHARHQQTALYFMGQVWGYGRPNAPWFYPLVMVGVTTPLFSLALMLGGAVKTLLKAWRRPHATLFLMIAAVLLAVACLPSTPRYDGERLFLQVFPFLALLGGSTFVTLIRMVENVGRGRGHAGDLSRYPLARLARASVLLLIVLDGGIACVLYYPHLLSYFNPAVGGIQGARNRGFEVTYWGDVVNRRVLERLNQLPNGSRIMPLALHELCLRDYQLWGYLKPELVIGGNPPYDFHLLQMRRGFFGTAEKALADGGKFKPIAQWDAAGIPLLALYKTGAEYESYLIWLKQNRVFDP